MEEENKQVNQKENMKASGNKLKSSEGNIQIYLLKQMMTSQSPIKKENSKFTKRVISALGQSVSDKAINNDLRLKFQQALGKLNKNPTLEIGFFELKEMINKFDNQDVLRLYISQLSILYRN